MEHNVMARGDVAKMIFEDDKERYDLLDFMAQCCARFGSRVHASVLMGNQFHLLLEPPEPNMMVGMKWILGVYSSGWNWWWQCKGHDFQGRTIAEVVNSEERDCNNTAARQMLGNRELVRLGTSETIGIRAFR